MVVGNKLDLVDEHELTTVIEKQNISANFLTSAKTGNGVNELFVELATLLATDA